MDSSFATPVQAAVRKRFDLCARTEPQLLLRLHWLGQALERRCGQILAVERRRSGAGRHVASIAYEVPLPECHAGGRRRRPLP